MRIAEFVELEQFRRQRLAARMALTFILIDAYFQLCRHGVVMSAEQGLLTDELARTSREQLVEEIVEQTKLSLSLAIEAAGGEGD